MILDLLPSFNAGELDPRMDARAGLDKYQAGCRTLKNFIPIPFGGASKRPGTKYVLTPTDSALKKRLIGFKSGLAEQYVVIFRVEGASGSFARPLTIQVVKNGALIFSSNDPPVGSDVTVKDFVTEAQLFEFQFKQLNDVLILVHPSYNVITLTRHADNDWRFADYFRGAAFSVASPLEANAWPPLRDENTTSITVTPNRPIHLQGANVVLTASAPLFPLGGAPTGAGFYFALSWSSFADGRGTLKLSCSATSSAANDTAWLLVVGAWNAYSLNYWDGYWEIHRSYDGGTTFEVIRHYKGENGTRNWTTGGSETLPCYLRLRFIGTRYTTGSAGSVPTTYAILEPTSLRIWALFYCDQCLSSTTANAYVVSPASIKSGTVTITIAVPAVVTWTAHGLSVDSPVMFRTTGALPTGLDVFTVYYVIAAGLTANAFQVSTSVGGPAVNTSGVQSGVHTAEAVFGTGAWAEGAFGTHRGFPRTVELHDDRVFFGGNAAEPLRLWGSTVGDFKNFRRLSLADSSIAATISSASNNSIQWLASLRGALIVGTDGSEHAITAPNDGILAPNNLKVETQSAYGSAYIAPVLVNYAALFLQRSKARVREFVFSQEVQGYVAPDMTRLSNILVQPGIKQWDLQRSLDTIVWGVTTDGKLVGMTYEREENVVGWHRHETDGTIESVAVIYGAEGASDEVYLIVNRTIGGSTVRYLEVLDPSAFANQRDGNASDLVLVDSAKVVTGAGLTTATGLSHLEGKTVQIVADGTRRNDGVVSGGSVAISGAAASKVVVGLAFEALLKPMKIEVPMRDGTAQMRHMKLTRLAARLWKSLGGEMRADDDAAWEALGYPSGTTAFTGDVELTLSAKTLPSLEFAIRSNDPLPLTILALVPKFDVSGQ